MTDEEHAAALHKGFQNLDKESAARENNQKEIDEVLVTLDQTRAKLEEKLEDERRNDHESSPTSGDQRAEEGPRRNAFQAWAHRCKLATRTS